MTDTDRIRAILFESIDEINGELPPEQQIEPSLDTVLFGNEGRLDSLALVSFVVIVEEKLRDAFERPLSLSDDKAMSQRTSPFRSVQTLHDYALRLVSEADDETASRVSE